MMVLLFYGVLKINMLTRENLIYLFGVIRKMALVLFKIANKTYTEVNDIREYTLPVNKK